MAFLLVKNLYKTGSRAYKTMYIQHKTTHSDTIIIIIIIISHCFVIDTKNLHMCVFVHCTIYAIGETSMWATHIHGQRSAIAALVSLSFRSINEKIGRPEVTDWKFDDNNFVWFAIP